MPLTGQSEPKLTRRGLLVVGSFTTSALLSGCEVPPPTYAAGAATAREGALPSTAPKLYMVDAPECTWCHWWRNQYEAEFEKSEARARLRFVQLHAPRIQQSLDESVWPEVDRWARQEAINAHAHGTPLFVLVQDHKLIFAGNSARYGWPGPYMQAILKATGLA